MLVQSRNVTILVCQHTIARNDEELVLARHLMFDNFGITCNDLRLGRNGGVLLVVEITQRPSQGEVSYSKRLKVRQRH